MKELGPYLVGLAAIAQYWIVELCKKYFKKGEVEIFESGTIEIGFGSFGPSIALTGTLNALHKDVFVKNIRLVLTRKKDEAKHFFNWRAFRPKTFSLTGPETTGYEIASSFLLTTKNPFKYNVFFADDQFLADTRPKISQLPKKWHEFMDEQISKLPPAPEDRLSRLYEDPTISEALHKEFAKQEKPIEIWTLLNHNFYWHEGEYEFEMAVETARPNRFFNKKWSFVLQKEDVDNLRLNIISLMRELCGFQVFCHFAYPQYRKA